MSLSRKEFDVLTSIEASKSPDFTQRELAQASGHSLGSVNKTLHLLEDAGLVSENQITEKDWKRWNPTGLRGRFFWRPVSVPAWFRSL